MELEKLNEEKNRFDYMAHHDTLTGLPNRLSLVELLEVKTTQERPFALMFIDLDGFKEVNDSYGHRFGDQLLIVFSQLLKNILPDFSNRVWPSPKKLRPRFRIRKVWGRSMTNCRKPSSLTSTSFSMADVDRSTASVVNLVGSGSGMKP